jgi:orotate phosphoribosyltransferase
MNNTQKITLDYRKASEIIKKHFAETPPEQIWNNLQSLGLTEASNLAIEQFKSTLVDLIIYCKQNGRDVFDVKEEGFLLENGKKSPYFINLSEISEASKSHELYQLMAGYVAPAIGKIHRIVGLLRKETATPENAPIFRERIHLAAGVAALVGKPSCDLVFEKDEQTEEPKLLLDGRLQPNQKVAIVDDVLTTGTNIIQAVKHLRKQGNEVSDAFVFISRAFGKPLEEIQDQLNGMGVTLDYIIDSRELFDRLYAGNHITKKDLEIVYQDEYFRQLQN